MKKVRCFKPDINPSNFYIEVLLTIATVGPHAFFARFIFGLKHRTHF